MSRPRTLSDFSETKKKKKPRTIAGKAHWKRIREVVFDRCYGICERCGISEARAVHHLTYARWNKERASDLLGVCHRCHRIIHKLSAGPFVPKKPRMSMNVKEYRQALRRAKAILRAQQGYNVKNPYKFPTIGRGK